MNNFRTIARLGKDYDFDRVLIIKSEYYTEWEYEALFLKDDNEVLEVFSEKAKVQWPLTEFVSVQKLSMYKKTVSEFEEEANTEEVKLYQAELAKYQRLKAKFEGR